MKIKIASVALFSMMLLQAGCASSGGEWTDKGGAADNPVAAEQQPMDASVEKKETKPWDDGYKY